MFCFQGMQFFGFPMLFITKGSPKYHTRKRLIKEYLNEEALVLLAIVRREIRHKTKNWVSLFVVCISSCIKFEKASQIAIYATHMSCVLRLVSELKSKAASHPVASRFKRDEESPGGIGYCAT